MSDQSPSLVRQATSGILWTSLSSLAARGLGFASTILLTRWITPDDYGLANAAYTLAITIGFFAIPGLESELIRRRQQFNQAATWAWLISVGIMLLLVGCAYFQADRVTDWMNAHGAATYFRYALIIPMCAVGLMVANTLLCQHLRFGVQSALEFGGSTANVAFAVVLAWQGYGGVAVVLGQVLREVIIRVGGTMATGLRWMEAPRYDSQLLRQMLHFGIPVYVAEILEFCATNWDNLFVSKWFGAQALGAYAVAYTVAYTPIQTIAQRSSAVVFATVSQFVHDADRRRAALLRAFSALMIALSPMAVLVMLCGPSVVGLLFPQKWTATVAALVSGLALVGIGLPLQFVPDYYFQAIGKPRATTIAMALKVIFLAACLFLFGRQSVVATAWAVSGAFVLAGAFSCAMLIVVDDISVRELFGALLPALTAAVLMSAAIYIVQTKLLVSSSTVLRLAIELVVGPVVYVGYLWIVHRARLLDILRAVRS